MIAIGEDRQTIYLTRGDVPGQFNRIAFYYPIYNFATKKDAKAYLEKLPKKTSIGLKTVHLSYFVCKMEKDSKKGKFYEKEELIRRRQNERVRKKRKT